MNSPKIGAFAEIKRTDNVGSFKHYTLTKNVSR